MEKRAEPIPKEYHSISPILVIRNAAEAVDYYQKAFGARVLFRQDSPDGKLMHAALKIGDSVFMLGEECAPHEGHAEQCVRSPDDLKGTTTNLYLYTENVDDLFKQALRAGGTEMMPVENTFWGDRMGMIRDPYGHVWSVATHVEDLTHEQMEQRIQEYFAQHA